jgi:hypothetical protein
MTIYAPGTPQSAIDADQASDDGTFLQKALKILPYIKKLTASRKIGNDRPQPPAPPRYDSGKIKVKTSANSSSSVRQWDPSANANANACPGGGYGAYCTTTYGSPPGMPVPPVYPQRPEGNISKQYGQICMTYANINHEMPHTEYKTMSADQQRDFHQFPFGPYQATQAPNPPTEEKKTAGQACGLCRKPGKPLRKFNCQGAKWTICSECAGTAFAAEGVHLWRTGEKVQE